MVTTLLVSIGVVLVASSCSDPADWYPDGSVSILAHYEFDDGLQKSLYVVTRVSNAGDMPISLSTFTLSLETAERPYWLTVSESTRILPGGAITLTITVAYLQQAEALVPGTLTVSDVYFD
jgi:hypothetical protein